ncbi:MULTISPECIES: LemA family protein [unclassified Lentimicrobium]|uniref:LemA family protein n=1 Tax=unclassified Lentimicrobium TaxID=2677434 RepID=UPI001DF3CAC4|nr:MULTISPECIES: LemA family protein [unclassified Lentimicrobium]NPD44634.1 LemA family protein [Lentimicrobium sp. S6]NPD83346.1 LemA family protein [Lentimicrobium sp. L6]
MSTMTIVIIVVVVLLGLIVMSMYNGLIRKKNEVENAFGGMDVQLKKRYDLIPNLVATVKQFMNHEKELLTKVTELRAQAMKSDVSTEQKVDFDNQITGAMKGIMVAVESYPDLKSNENFLNLQRTFNEVESQISAARRAYNASVTDFNNGVQMFPSSIIAGMMKLQTKKVFEIPEVERENVNAKDLFAS